MLSADERAWAAEVLEELRWKADQLVGPPDLPGMWWLAHCTEGGLIGCCQRDHPCPHHAGQPVDGHVISWSNERNWWVCSCGVLSAEHEEG
jgi:hypothetical protein